MKNKIKTIVLALAIAPALSMLAGCEKKTSSGPGFSFWYPFSHASQDRILKQISQFKSIIKNRDGVNLKITVSKLGDYAAIKTKLEEGGFSTGNIPTMTVAYPDHVASYMARGKKEGNSLKYVWKLDDYFTDPEIGFGRQPELGDDVERDAGEGKDGDFFASYIDEGRHFIESGTYTIPFAKSTELLYYNKELVWKYLDHYEDAAGRDYASFINSLSWDNFIKFAKFIRSDLNKPNSERLVPYNVTATSDPTPNYVFGYDSDSNMFITRLIQQGIPYSSIKADKTGNIDFASGTDAYDQVTDDLLELRNLYRQGILITKKTNGDEYASNLFTEQETIFTIGSSGGSDYNAPKGKGFTVNVSKVPELNGTAKYVSQGVTLAFLKNPKQNEEKNLQNFKYAWQFMKFITNSSQNLLFCTDSNGYFPVKQGALETEDWEDLTEGDAPSAKAYKCMVSQVKHSYFNTALFQGCAELREEVGKLLAQALIDAAGTEASIHNLIDACVKEANKTIG